MFTVVIPLFEKGPYVWRALESVCGQTCSVAEIIVVNDGSTDGGEEFARAFVPPAGGPALRVIDQPNRGVSAARNAGIAAATQPFVAFLDADDRWRPGFLAAMQVLIDRHPEAVLYGSGFVTVAGDREVHRYGVRPAENSGGTTDLFRALARDHVVHPSSMVVPRAAALAVGGFPEGVSHCEDMWFWTKLALAGSVVLTPEPLALYDVGVPGQAVEYWQGAYRERFDVLEYHRFLAEELRRLAPAAGPAQGARASFATYARQQLRTAALQRLYWGNFAALDRLWRELRLGDLALGWPVPACGWIARHPAVQPAVGAVLAVARSIRESLKPCRPRGAAAA